MKIIKIKEIVMKIVTMTVKMIMIVKIIKIKEVAMTIVKMTMKVNKKMFKFRVNKIMFKFRMIKNKMIKNNKIQNLINNCNVALIKYMVIT